MIGGSDEIGMDRLMSGVAKSSNDVIAQRRKDVENE